MSAMIIAIDRQAHRRQHVDGVGIAPEMLTHAVCDLDHGAGIAAAVPARASNAHAIITSQPKCGVGNRGALLGCHVRSPDQFTSHRP
jgi:hypothetical protein